MSGARKPHSLILSHEFERLDDESLSDSLARRLQLDNQAAQRFTKFLEDYQEQDTIKVGGGFGMELYAGEAFSGCSESLLVHIRCSTTRDASDPLGYFVALGSLNNGRPPAIMTVRAVHTPNSCRPYDRALEVVSPRGLMHDKYPRDQTRIGWHTKEDGSRQFFFKDGLFNPIEVPFAPLPGIVGKYVELRDHTIDFNA